MRIRLLIWSLFLSVLVLPALAEDFPVKSSDIETLQKSMYGLPLGQRIAAWAEKFVGVPYDTDPLGFYVSTRRIVADESVDCMYHVFRSTELAMANSPQAAIERALEMRFRTRGRLAEDGLVKNYDERYEYGIDMVRSGKWGTDITRTLGSTVRLPGERGIEYVDMLPSSGIPGALGSLESGDIVFFIKKPEKRVVGEIVGHMGILKREGEEVFLIHASGRKKVGGRVVKLPLRDYVSDMPFAGIMVTRF